MLKGWWWKEWIKKINTRHQKRKGIGLYFFKTELRNPHDKSWPSFGLGTPSGYNIDTSGPLKTIRISWEGISWIVNVEWSNSQKIENVHEFCQRQRLLFMFIKFGEVWLKHSLKYCKYILLFQSTSYMSFSPRHFLSCFFRYFIYFVARGFYTWYSHGMGQLQLLRHSQMQEELVWLLQK